MKSMTGYAYEEVLKDDTSISVEIKSYNSRFLDISVNIPPFLSRLEMKIREYATRFMMRGKVELYIKVREKNAHLSIFADVDAAKAYITEIKKVASLLGEGSEIPLSLVVAQEGVITSQRELDIDRYWALLEPVLNNALTQFVRDREREGANLKKDIQKMSEKLSACAAVFTEWQPKMEEIFRENVQKRFHEVLGNEVDEQRIMQETAALLVKYTINEEIVRLKSHLDSLNKEITQNDCPGRKLDFICQEINREINTIGSKNQIMQVGEAVISAKDALENIREQIRNIE